jgi:hypothetical protein
VIELFGISHVDDSVQLELPAVYPDTMAPVVMLDDNGARNRAENRQSAVLLGKRELNEMARSNSLYEPVQSMRARHTYSASK